MCVCVIERVCAACGRVRPHPRDRIISVHISYTTFDTNCNSVALRLKSQKTNARGPPCIFTFSVLIFFVCTLAGPRTPDDTSHHTAPRSSVDLVLTNGKRMVKALPMALPGASQGCRTLGYDRGGDKAPQTRSNGCREIVFGHDAPLWSEPFNRSRTVMAAVRVAHPPAPRRLPRELSYHPQHP